MKPTGTCRLPRCKRPVDDDTGKVHLVNTVTGETIPLCNRHLAALLFGGKKRGD